MKYCTKCGNQLLDEAVICMKCGCMVEGARLVNPQPVQQKKPIAPKDVLSINSTILEYRKQVNLAFGLSIAGICVMGIIGIILAAIGASKLPAYISKKDVNKDELEMIEGIEQRISQIKKINIATYILSAIWIVVCIWLIYSMF